MASRALTCDSAYLGAIGCYDQSSNTLDEMIDGAELDAGLN